MTEDQLIEIMPQAKMRASLFLDSLNAAMDEFEINTLLRIAAFIAQVGHESGQLQYVEEIASGKGYEGRADLGNTVPGDGIKFKGRGLIQITGRANYKECGDALGLDLISDPKQLAEIDNACRSAAWFWKRHGLNELADTEEFVRITKRINGGINGLGERQAFYAKAKKVLGE